MTQAEFIGMLVLSLSTIIGTFIAVYKPLNENTKAMTTLSVKIEQFAIRMDERDKEFKEHEKEFREYKEHVSKSQKEQWNKIDEHSLKLQKQEMEIKYLKGED